MQGQFLPTGPSDLLNASAPPNDSHPQTPISGLGDACLQSVAPLVLTATAQQQADSTRQAWVGDDDIGESNLDQHEGNIFDFVSFSAADAELVFDDSQSDPIDADLSNISSASCVSFLNSQDRGNKRQKSSTLTTDLREAPQESMLPSDSFVGTKGRALSQNSSDDCLATLDQLSKLNLELHRHLKRIDVVQSSTPEQARMPNILSHEDLDSLLPVAIMIRGIQKFQELLQCYSTLGCTTSSRTINRTPPTDRTASSSYGDGARLLKRPRPSISSSSCSSRDFTNPVSPASQTSWTQSSATSVSDDFLNHNGHRKSLKSHHQKQIADTLDLPTRMLFLTCHINLMRLCCRVFSNIRQCLVSWGHESILARLSDLFISGVSLNDDGHLQIDVLIQIVSRKLDRISAALGYSKIHSILPGDSQHEDIGRILSDKSATPKLVEILMREEELSGAQDLSAGGIKALREEIRELRILLSL
ncbi:MAG: hypothetical protein Q9166_005920 [cf. Caloplaca sp. 2 TL-2023]